MGVVAAVGTAVTAIASSVGIAVTATALTVGFTTIAAVGAVLGVVGQVTHIKALSYAGLALGAVGGIGALASSAGLLGSGAGLLGEAPTTAAAADAAAAGTIDSVAGVGNAAAAEEMLGLPAAGSVEAGGAAGGVGFSDIAGAAKPLGGLIQAAPSDGPAGALSATGNDAGQTGADAQNAKELERVKGLMNTGSPVAEATAPGAATTPLVPPPAAPGTSAAGTGRFTLGAGPGAVTGDAGGSGSTFGGILEFANKNPVVALGALQSAGAFLAGSTSSLTPAQVKLYESQAASNDQATLLVKQQQQNLAAPKAVAQSVPVTGQAQLVPTALRPQPLQVQAAAPQGFINQAPTPIGVAA